jgi:hypothetical protein
LRLKMTDAANPENPAVKSRILVEGPAWGDAQFYGNWLLNSAKANQLLRELEKVDPQICEELVSMDGGICHDFGINALIFLRKLGDTTFETFIIDPESSDLIAFIFMVEMGFFSLTGERYQMTLPRDLNMDKLRQAILNIANTEEEECVIHPERLVAQMPYSRAKAFQCLLADMNQSQRLADRNRLLFLD